MMLEKARFSDIVCRKLQLSAAPADMAEWQAMVDRVLHPAGTVRIAMVGKYMQLHDAYLSVAEALHHAGYALGRRVEIDWVDSETVTEANAEERLGGADGILVPGGFGDRGTRGMIAAAQYARTKKKPYLGICLGMQITVIEYARHVVGWEDANSRECSPVTAHPVVDFMPDKNDAIDKGGTLRLGAYPCVIGEGTMMEKCYGARQISERHRHRYEINNAFRNELARAGLIFSGLSPDGRLVETVEIREHPFFVGVQYHQEFKSRPNKPHPLFLGLIRASMG